LFSCIFVYLPYDMLTLANPLYEVWSHLWRLWCVLSARISLCI